MSNSFAKLAEYYQTMHWRTLSAEVRKRVNRCQLNLDHLGPLQVHHNTYRNLGNEDPLDLVVLCQECHRLIAHPDHLDEDDMLDLNTRDLSTRIRCLIDVAMTAKNRGQAPRNYIGGSRLGEPCERKLQYEYFHTTPDAEFEGRILRIFHRGHEGENWMAQWLTMAGFVLKTADKEGKQFGFSVAGGRIAGHIDGVIVAGPDGFGPFPRLWENKVLGAKGWNKLAKEKTRKAYPVYHAQCNVYMAYMDLSDNPALFTAINADTMDIYAENIEFDPQLAQAVSDKGVRVLRACDAGELLPRLSDDSSWFECKMCPYYQRCHHG